MITFNTQYILKISQLTLPYQALYKSNSISINTRLHTSDAPGEISVNNIEFVPLLGHTIEIYPKPLKR